MDPAIEAARIEAGRIGAPATEREMPSLLRKEVRLLGDILGRVIEEAGGPDLLADVDRLREATITLRGKESDENRAAVLSIVEGFDLDRAESVARAFTI